MKHLKVAALALVFLMVAGSRVNAQTKIGYIDAETLLYLMPEVAKVDSQLRQYQLDTLGREYQRLLTDYQWKDSMLKTDATKPLPPQIKEQYQKDLQELTQTLTNWQSIAGELNQQKQQILIAPAMRKLSDAINAVAKEKGYTHVLSREVFIVAPDADNLIVAVAAKLKVTLPPELIPGGKPAANPGAKPAGR
ncbi:OmpH family outer membrane protein [Nostoc ellipsosporum NOK]|jgi:outer membrane protein|nr:OmpH family outer membrane protein [Nostoc ellipsosporum NOK]